MISTFQWLTFNITTFELLTTNLLTRLCVFLKRFSDLRVSYAFRRSQFLQLAEITSYTPRRIIRGQIKQPESRATFQSLWNGWYQVILIQETKF